MALIVTMIATAVLLALGLGLALTTTVESGIARNYRDGIETRLAADAALELAIDELNRTADWDAVLRGERRSPLDEGADAVRLADGTWLDLIAETNLLRCGSAGGCTDAEMDAVTATRPWGRNNPRWQRYASGSLDGLARDGQAPSRAYVTVWVGDDPAENDAQPLADGRAPAVADARNTENRGRHVLSLVVHAYGAAGGRRAFEAVIERDQRFAPVELRVRAWRAIP